MKKSILTTCPNFGGHHKLLIKYSIKVSTVMVAEGLFGTSGKFFFMSDSPVLYKEMSGASGINLRINSFLLADNIVVRY